MSRNLARDPRVAASKPPYQHERGFMEPAGLPQESTTHRNGWSTVLVAGDRSQDLSQLHDDEIQKDELKIRADAHAAFERHQRVGYGLRCANCKAYYASGLAACPICKCAERVPASGAKAKSAKILKKASRGVLQHALRSFINLDPTPGRQRRQLAVHGDQDEKRFQS